MIIGVCGYSYTGSGAVIDLLKEFSEIQYAYDGEFSITNYPDGVCDLDYHLNKQFNKYATSAVALDRFKKLSFILFSQYSKLANEKKRKIEELTDEYITGLIQVEWFGYGLSNSISDYGRRNYYLLQSSFERIIRYVYRYILKNCRITHYPMQNIRLSVVPDDFDKKTSDYITSLLEVLGYEKNKIAVLNQPFSVNNPGLAFKYFDDPRAIIVDRDPRDLYLYTKFYLKNAATQIPIDSVEKFVEYYKRTHAYSSDTANNERILRINFEDLCYEYEKTLNLITDFCGISEHKKVKTYFDPEKSINNTQMMERFNYDPEDIQYIENRLSEFLFPFEKYPKPNKGKMFI